ncbi:glycosyltransferase family 4 protein [Bacillus salitolerans]|uniref:Glycosyltransferase family 4 protein n=1 Tax=Bacillus salitolerans TaxID=1437434 RepID=A0ABW4LXF8_9BACI
MKIAIFTDTFAPQVNGVARTLKRFTDYLDQQGIDYKVFAPDCTKDEELFSTHIHRFTSLPFFLYPECRLALPNMLHVRNQLSQFKPDIIHVATPFNVGLCGIHYAKKLNIPLVGSYHTDFDQYLEYYDLQFLSTLLWKYMTWFHRSFLKTFVPSQETKEQLRRHGFTNLHVWSRGVDGSVFKPLESTQQLRQKYDIHEKYILSYVGRLAPEKDVDTLLGIMNQLPLALQHNVRFLIVGDGPSKADLERQVPTNVTFTGYLGGQELAEVYAGSDLFIFPSPTETFGNVVLEALACGTPVVGANSGGVKNIIKNGITGILCEPKKVSSFVHAIESLLSNDELRKNMQHEARTYALTQTWDSIFESLLYEYETALHRSNEKKFA